MARQVFSSRAERYEHRATQHFGLTSQQVALLGLLLLRGPQTAGELLARSERLHAFADVEGVRHQLERMARREPALVVQLPRGGGQREDRFAHLLCGPVDVSAIAAREPGGAGESSSPGLAARVAALEAEVAALREQLERLLQATTQETGTAT